MSLVSGYLLLYLLILLGITVISSRRETPEEYINAGKNLSASKSAWTTFASLLTGYNFVLGVTFSYLYGLWYLMIFIGAGMAFVVLYLFYKSKLVTLQREHDLLSVGDYFGLQFGPFSKLMVNLILIGGILLFLTLQIFINTGLFSTLLGIGTFSALLLTTGVVCIYLWFGGFKVSVNTDIFQGILMLPIVLVVFVFPIHFTVEKLPSALDTSQFWFAVGLTLLQFFSLLGQAESFQRIFAARDPKSLKKGLVTAFLLLSLVAGAIAYLGINFKFGGINVPPGDLFTKGVLEVLPEWLKSLLIVSLIAAFMGTIDSSAFAFGVLAARVYEREGASVKLTQVFTLIGIIISAAGSMYFYSLLAPAFALIALISVIGAALFASLLFRLLPLDINIFLVVGTITFISGVIFSFITENPLTALIPIGVSFGVLLVFLVYRRVILYPTMITTPPIDGKR